MALLGRSVKLENCLSDRIIWQGYAGNSYPSKKQQQMLRAKIPRLILFLSSIITCGKTLSNLPRNPCSKARNRAPMHWARWIESRRW
jgi:hypothetical protein